jgi:hypothetical protein
MLISVQEQGSHWPERTEITTLLTGSEQFNTKGE